MKIGIIGNGFVGQSTFLLHPSAIIYDILPEKCIPPEVNMRDISACNIIFICVPTPVQSNGECYIKHVENIINTIRSHDSTAHIIIRSTVPPGTCDRLHVHFLPEFLTEKNWVHDAKNEPIRLIGINRNIHNHMEFIEIIGELYKKAKEYGYINTAIIEIVNPLEAEIVKYTRNAFLAVKVAFFNEIYSLCKNLHTDFESVRKMVLADQRINYSHTSVPGSDGRFGFGGTCLPKDLVIFINEFNKRKVENHVMTAALHRNNYIDRPEKDWKQSDRAFFD